jgi:putative transposase
VKHVVVSLRVSERRACQTIGQVRTSYRYEPKPNPEQEKLRERVVAVAQEFSRYGYRQVTDILNMEGFDVGKDRVYRIWREEGLKVPQKAPKRARLFLADGSTIRLRPTHRNHVWCYDFVADRTHNGSPYKILNIVDEHSRECLASFTAKRIRSGDVIRVLAELFLKHGCPEHIRSDNGPEFIATRLREWLEDLQVKPLYIEPGSPWENGYCESFNGKMRYELLDGEIFYTLFEAKTIIERWRIHYNTKRPHSSLGGRPPAPVTMQLAS